MSAPSPPRHIPHFIAFSLDRPSRRLPFAPSSPSAHRLIRDGLQLDKYMPSVSLVDDVFRLKARGLLVAGFASAVMLAWFGTLMYLVERNDNEVEVRAQA